MSGHWLALLIGNSRLHWAAFQGSSMVGSWHTRHCSAAEARQLYQENFKADAWNILQPGLRRQLSPMLGNSGPYRLWLAAVVAHQQAHWLPYRHCQSLQHCDIPLQGKYSTLGIDRSLALWGAGRRYGWPVLVVDGGTALTLTAGVAGAFWGGAILPGLGLQLRALGQQTDALPEVALPATSEILRWARDTTTAIQSGVVYGTLGGLQSYLSHWWQQYPQGNVIFTGGDGPFLEKCLGANQPQARIHVDETLVFQGICAIVNPDNAAQSRPYTQA